MDAAQALADLTEISSQINAAVLFDASGVIYGSTFPDPDPTSALATAAADLLDRAAAFRTAGVEVTQLEVSTHEGSVFVVADGPRRIAATTRAEPTVGLVFYDLKSCLRGAAADEPAKSRWRRRTNGEAGDGEA